MILEIQKLLDEHLSNTDIVIHLACISNDPSFELNQNLVNHKFRCVNLVKICKKNVKDLSMRLHLLSGIKKDKNVHENMS